MYMTLKGVADTAFIVHSSPIKYDSLNNVYIHISCIVKKSSGNV